MILQCKLELFEPRSCGSYGSCLPIGCGVVLCDRGAGGMGFRSERQARSFQTSRFFFAVLLQRKRIVVALEAICGMPCIDHDAPSVAMAIEDLNSAVQILYCWNISRRIDKRF